MYLFVKLFHILFAIIGIGFNLSYVVWLMKAQKEEKHLLFILRGIKFLDDWFANPAYILTLLSGLLMCWIADYDLLKTTWLLYPLVLFSIMGIIGFGFYSPALKKQIRMLELHGNDSDLYKKADKKQIRIGVILFVLAIAILSIMVIKPS
jgi:uncharacterized membrane protein